MWKMFEDSTDIMEENSVKSQSMELVDSSSAIEGYEDDDGIFHFTKFIFRAACILGEDVTPAMMNSTVEVQFTMNDFVKEMQEELFSKMTSFQQIQNTQNTQQGGVEIMGKQNTEPVNTNSKTNFSQTVMEMFSDICNIVRDYEEIETYWHDRIPRYCLCDIQDNEAIVMDRKNNYNYYGVPFTVEGDKPVLDFAQATRKKIQYADYVEGEPEAPEGAFNFADEIKDFEAVCQQKVADMESSKDAIIAEKDVEFTTKSEEYIELKDKFDEIEPKYKKTAIINQYSTALGTNEDFKKIVSDHKDMSVDDVESKCAVIYSRQILFSKVDDKTKSSAINIPIDEGESNIVNTKYGAISKR
jgi:hypothetical protein